MQLCAKSFNHQHFIHFHFPHNASMPQEGFPSPYPSSEATAIFVLRIHDRLGLEKPLNDHIVAFLRCLMQRCLASGSRGPMAQALQAEPNGTDWEKNFEKILGISKDQNSSLKLNIVVLRCLEAVELLNKNSCLWSSLVKMAWINSNILQL